MPDVWRPIPGWLGLYEAGSGGDIRSLRSGRPLSQTIGHGGYRRVTLSRGTGSRLEAVHRLVASAFIGPCPDGLVVRHLDGDPSNNRAENLTYGTHSENALDRVRHGRDANSAKTCCRNGHPYDEVNTYAYSRGRKCRECNRDAARRYKSRRKNGTGATR